MKKTTLTLVISAMLGPGLMACTAESESGKVETQTNIKTGISPNKAEFLSNGTQRGTGGDLFSYSGKTETRAFMLRYAPAHRFADISDADIIAAFLDSPISEATARGKTLILRQQSALNSCVPFHEAWARHIGEDIRSQIFIEYPADFVDSWKSMRFTSGVFFGPIIGIVTNADKTDILYFVEQSHIDWTQDKHILAISSATRKSPVTLTLIELDSDPYVALSKSITNTPTPKPKEYCQLVPEMDPREALDEINRSMKDM